MTRARLLAVAGAVAVVVTAALLRNSLGTDADPGPIHVHGLGMNPADGSLFIATHTGLFRVDAASRKAVRVADRSQDTMGFSVVGPNRFIGSGHPDRRDRNLPSRLGLIESTDAGNSWKSVSLLGDADFHVLRSLRRHVWGYDHSNDRLLASVDGGRTWKELHEPGPIVDLAPNPVDPERLVTTADQGTFESRDGGESWTRLNDAVGLLAWPAPKQLYLADDEGNVLVSSDGGRTLTTRGEVGGQPAALLAAGKDELYVALHDGTVKRSLDGGTTWTIRSRP